MGLLERADQIAVVVERFTDLDRGGHLVLISGEAGVGKSALVQELLDHHLSGGRVLLGRCDDLFAPRPLGPLADIARAHPGPLGEALTGGDQSQVFDAILTELAAPPAPTVLVLEDLQWADEATLDLVRFVARRLDSLPCLVLATHRDDVPQDHPIRLAIGTLVGPRVTRLQVPPLSVDAVRDLVGDRLLDAAKLHAATGGNPFFLIETLAAEPGTLPVTVRDVVLARAAPLSGPARDALDAAAVLGRHADVALVQSVADCDTSALEECLHAGLLVDDAGLQAFRHDLVRDAVEESMTPLRRRQLHARALEALGDDGDIVQRAHHAIGADDEAAIVDLAGQAADACLALGALREAALLYTAALDHTEPGDPERLRLLDAYAPTALRIERTEAAVSAGDELLAALEELGDPVRLGRWEIFLSRAYRAIGRGREANVLNERAAARLEPLGDSPTLAEALSSMTGQYLVSGQFGACTATAHRAIEMATRFGLEEPVVYALNSLGAALGSTGHLDEGEASLRESFDRAKAAGLHDAVGRACANLAFTLMVNAHVKPALTVLDEGIAISDEQELRFQLNCLRPGRAEALTFLGRWDEAVAELGEVLIDPWAAPINRAIVLPGLARIRVRRGDPGSQEPLDEAMHLVEDMEEAQLYVPVRLVAAERAWLAGDLARAAAEVEACLPHVELLDLAAEREIYLWCTRTGVDWAPPDLDRDVVLRCLSDGDHRTRGEWWLERDCLYEGADALVDSDDPDDVRRGLAILTDLGARPRANMAARKLRDLGVRDVPRGPRASTRANPAGLTARELEVASLLAEGLTNAEIAERLIVSAKTVDHHASAVLTKLGVSSRRHVARAAADLGVDLTAPAAGS